MQTHVKGVAMDYLITAPSDEKFQELLEYLAKNVAKFWVVSKRWKHVTTKLGQHQVTELQAQGFTVEELDKGDIEFHLAQPA
jgi:hypothetical protein